jgi:hypothetical protein
MASSLPVLYNTRGQDSRFSLNSRSLVVLFTIGCYTGCGISVNRGSQRPQRGSAQEGRVTDVEG